MFYYKFTSGTPQCGTENDRYHKFEDKPKIDELEEIAEEEAEEYMDNFRADCYCEYKEISREEYEENA